MSKYVDHAGISAAIMTRKYKRVRPNAVELRYVMPVYMQLWCTILLDLGFKTRAIKRMKKYSLSAVAFMAIIVSGAFADVNAKIQAAHETTVTETENGVEFTDVNGNTQQAIEGDALKEVNNEDGSFKGWELVTAGAVADWQEETEEGEADAEQAHA